MRRAWRELMMMAGIDRRAIVTFLLLCLVIGIDKADQLLLPAVYLEICREFSIGPAFLGLITFWRGVLQAVVAVLAGPLGGRFDRVRLISFGVLLWAVASALVGAATSIEALWVARAVTGAGLGLTIPLIFALVADLAPDGKRGRAFGLLLFAANGGGAVGAYAATSMAAAAVLVKASLAGVLHSIRLLSCLSSRPRSSYALRTSRGAAAAQPTHLLPHRRRLPNLLPPLLLQYHHLSPSAALSTTHGPFSASNPLLSSSRKAPSARPRGIPCPSLPCTFRHLSIATTAQQQHLPPPHSHPFPPSCCTPHQVL